MKNKENEEKTENKEDEEEVSIVMAGEKVSEMCLDHQVNIADWTLESWLAVKGATSSKDENLL